ncbi:MAG: SCO family protein [Cyclobacteriaceae bacterium]|nr:SCO family protein [Cyclobacteriaceae bacterium]
MDYWEQNIASMYRIAFALCSILIVSCGSHSTTSLPYFNTPDFEPIFISDPDQVSKTITHTISDFSFTDQNNKHVTAVDITGKVHVANFVFTSCGSICPIMTNHMKLVNEVFGNKTDVEMLSFTVTPWIDDVSTLKAYADKNNISSSNWHFLTGKKSDIYTLARQSYFAEEDLGFTKDSTEFLHTEHFILVDQHKRIRGIYNGTLELDVRQLIADIRTLQAEANDQTK